MFSGLPRKATFDLPASRSDFIGRAPCAVPVRRHGATVTTAADLRASAAEQASPARDVTVASGVARRGAPRWPAERHRSLPARPSKEDLE